MTESADFPLTDENYFDELTKFVSKVKGWGLLVDACKDEKTDGTITKIFEEEIRPGILAFQKYLRNGFEVAETKEEVQSLWHDKLLPLHKGMRNNFYEYLFRNMIHEPPLEPEFLLALYYTEERDFITPIRFRNAIDGKYQSLIEKWDKKKGDAA